MTCCPRVVGRGCLDDSKISRAVRKGSISEITLVFGGAFVDWSVCLSVIGCRTVVAWNLVDDVEGEVWRRSGLVDDVGGEVWRRSGIGLRQ